MDLWSAIFTVIRRWYVSLPILAIAVVAMFAIGGRIQPDYEAKASIVFNPPVRKIVSGQEQTFRNQYAEDTQTLAAAVYRQINSSDEQRRLEEDGFSPRYEVELDQFSAIMDFTVTGTSPEQALDTANQLIRESERTALAIQRQGQPPEDELVNVDAVSLPVDAELVPGSKTRVMATILLLGLVGAASAAFIVESLVTRRRQGTLGVPPVVDPAYAYAPYPQLPPGVYAPPAAYAGYAPAMPVPAAQPTPARTPAPQVAPTPAPAYAGANGYATAAPTADPANEADSRALDSLLAEVDSDEQLAPRRAPEGQVINRGRTASGPDGSDRGRPPLTPFEGPGDEPDAPILVGAGEDEGAEELTQGADESTTQTDDDDGVPAPVLGRVHDDVAEEVEGTGDADHWAEGEGEPDADAEAATAEAEDEVEIETPTDSDQSGAEVEVEVEADEADTVEPEVAEAEPSEIAEDEAAAEDDAAAAELEDDDFAALEDDAELEYDAELEDDADAELESIVADDEPPTDEATQAAAPTAEPVEATTDEAAEAETVPDTAPEPEPVPSVLHRSEVSERRREPGGGSRQRGGRNPGADRGNGRAGSSAGSGRGGAGSGQGGGGTDRNGRVRNQGNSRSASRRNRRSLFAPPPEAPTPDGGTSSTVPASGVTAEASAPDGD